MYIYIYIYTYVYTYMYMYILNSLVLKNKSYFGFDSFCSCLEKFLGFQGCNRYSFLRRIRIRGRNLPEPPNQNQQIQKNNEIENGFVIRFVHHICARGCRMGSGEGGGVSLGVSLSTNTIRISLSIQHPSA